MKYITLPILVIWQILQNIVAIILLAYLRCLGKVHKTDIVDNVLILQSDNMSGAISLGNFIVLGCGMDSEVTILHELGHCWQSRLLGPLYLFAIGIPSITWCYIHDCNKDKYKDVSYYDFYTERWANDKAGLEVVKYPEKKCYSWLVKKK